MPTKDKMDSVVRFWLNEISASKKREKDFRKDGQKILDIYSGKKATQTPYNILFSNTETLLPALYSAVPRPVVQRRFKDEDPLGKSAALAGQRVLEFLLDTNVEGYETFDQGIRAATLDALLPGRGITSVKYDASINDVYEEQATPDAEEKEPIPVKSSELVCVETKSWNRVYFGYARKWSKVPWMAYEEHIDREEAERLFGKDVSNKINYTEDEEDEDEENKTNSSERDKGEKKTACIYQIWDKDGGHKIRYVSSHYTEGFLKVEDDPLSLTGFFNCPKPIMFLEKSNDLLPVALYALYENQAAELNKLTQRKMKIISAIKATGIYDTELGSDIANIIKAEENQLVPADKTSSLAAEKGLQNAIWFWPVDKLIIVLRELYVAIEQCKQIIYEITGIADILRGASKASETLGAQEIKERWGGLRLKRLQKEVQRYARDLLRLQLEVAATKFSEETWAKMTGLPFLLEPKFNELSQISQLLTQKVQQEQMQQQMQAQPGQPQQPPSQSMQQLQQVQQQLQAPQWSKILEMLRDDTQRSYRIDIETNSTVEPEAVEDQKNIADLMNAISQYLNGVGPLIAKGVMPFEAAQAMLLAITRRFRFGSEVEDYIHQMKAPPPEDNGQAGEQAKLAAAQQQHQAELQQQAQIEMAKHQREQQSEQNRVQSESAKLQMTKDIEVAKIQAEQVKEAAKIDAEKQARIAELQAERATEQMKAQMQQDTELRKATLAAATQIEIARISATKDAAEKVTPEAGNQVNDIMQQIMSQQTQLMKIISSPKSVERDKNGRALRLVTEGV